MSTFQTEADDHRERYCPDVIVTENAHRQIRIHQVWGTVENNNEVIDVAA